MIKIVKALWQWISGNSRLLKPSPSNRFQGPCPSCTGSGPFYDDGSKLCTACDTSYYP